MAFQNGHRRRTMMKEAFIVWRAAQICTKRGGGRVSACLPGDCHWLAGIRDVDRDAQKQFRKELPAWSGENDQFRDNQLAEKHTRLRLIVTKLQVAAFTSVLPANHSRRREHANSSRPIWRCYSKDAGKPCPTSSLHHTYEMRLYRAGM
jgi:hypothetical protein